MKTILLAAALAWAPWQLHAAKKPAPAQAIHSEPESPDVRPDGSPEVADPDLKEAMPAMRQGADEPVGGFKDAGLRGRSATFVSVNAEDPGAETLLGWRHWLGDGLAPQFGIGGYYSDGNGNSFRSGLVEALGLRLRLGELGNAGFAFMDLRGTARQARASSRSETAFPGYKQSVSDELWSNQYALGLRVGAELFWPGSRRFSLEASGGLGAQWSYGQRVLTQASDVLSMGTNSRSESRDERFDFGSRVGSLSMALNLYR